MCVPRQLVADVGLRSGSNLAMLVEVFETMFYETKVVRDISIKPRYQ